MQAAARTLGVELHLLQAGTDSELDGAFNSLEELRLGALMIANDPFFNSRSEELAELTRRHSVPAIYQYRRFVEAGGLISLVQATRHRTVSLVPMSAASSRARSPPTSRYERSMKLDLFINLKTANALGLTPPQSMLVRADEVIE